MNTTANIYLSKKGFKELRKTIARLERDRQEGLTRLRELDKTDGHDERLARIEQLAAIEITESTLDNKKRILVQAKPLPRKRDALKVAIGSVVDLLDTSGRIVRYTLVDSIEANPSDGRISIKSPLGQKLIGKQIRDIVEWSNTMRSSRFQLVSIA